MDTSEMSEEQKAILQQFRINVADILKPSHDDYYLTRWLKARKFNIQKAEHMLREHMEFYKKYKMDTLRKDFVMPEFITNHIPYSSTGFDRDGNVLLIFRTGKTDLKGAVSSLTLHHHTKIFLVFLENCLHKMKEENLKTGKNGRKIIIISDMKDMEARQFSNRPVLARLAALLQVFAANYPETLKAFYCTNVPRFFYISYNILTKLLDAEMIAKFKIFEADGFLEDMLQTIDADKLPAFLGGTLTDPDGNPECETMFVKDTVIPTKYYLCNNKPKLVDDPDARKITVKEGNYFNHIVEVKEPMSILRWEFSTQGSSIKFGVYFQPKGTSLVTEVTVRAQNKLFRQNSKRNSMEGCEILLPLETVESHLAQEEDELICEKTGTYVLHFDNTSSWMTPKELHYKVELFSSSASYEPNSENATVIPAGDGM